MTKIVTVLCHHPRTGSGALLAEALRARGINARTATYGSRRHAPRAHRIVINLGVSANPPNFVQRQLSVSNSADAVRYASNKAFTFQALQLSGVPAVEDEDDLSIVQDWLEKDGKIVVRHVLNGHSGQGIEIVRRGATIPATQGLYTRYFRKDAEYRVHVAFGEVILIQQKRRANGREQNEIERLVRTHANGWKFTTNGLSCDERGYADALRSLGLRAASAVGANHCAVDILVKHGEPNDLRVCEINSAPALRSSSTLTAYTNAFERWINSL